MLRSYSLNRILVLFVTIGFAFFLVDTILEHRDVLVKELASLIPVIYSALGVIIGGIAFAKWNASIIKSFQIYLLAGMLVGLGGVYFHVAEDDDEKKEEVKATNPDEDQAKPGEEKEKDKPPLAPLAFAGLSALGLIATSKTWKAESFPSDENAPE